jgi:hypothetical protein
VWASGSSGADQAVEAGQRRLVLTEVTVREPAVRVVRVALRIEPERLIERRRGIFGAVQVEQRDPRALSVTRSRAVLRPHGLEQRRRFHAQLPRANRSPRSRAAFAAPTK